MALAVERPLAISMWDFPWIEHGAGIGTVLVDGRYEGD
jgi:hypothetical protein